MSGPRTSAKPYLSAGLAVLVASSLPLARADDCFIDENGFEHCRLSTGVRIAIAIIIIVVFIVLLIAAGMYRRRRLMRANMMYVNQQQPQYYGGYGQHPYGNGQPGYDPTNAQQYPPPPNQGYGGGYAPPAGPPPAQQGGYYPSPQSPPPAHYNTAQGKV